jgi:hypothetical protein
MYLKIDGNKVLGFLKTENKKLFYRDNTGKVIEIMPVCVMVNFLLRIFMFMKVYKDKGWV